MTSSTGAQLSVVTMPPDKPDPYPPGHECGYTCGCGVDRLKVAAAMARGVRHRTPPVPLKRAA